MTVPLCLVLLCSQSQNLSHFISVLQYSFAFISLLHLSGLYLSSNYVAT